MSITDLLSKVRLIGDKAPKTSGGEDALPTGKTNSAGK
jgi:hypothetical protein